MASQYVKWPTKNSFDEWVTKEEWDELDPKMREFITARIKNCSTKDAVFALGEILADLYSQKVKTKSEKQRRKLELQHDYVLNVYDYLFERIL